MSNNNNKKEQSTPHDLDYIAATVVSWSPVTILVAPVYTFVSLLLLLSLTTAEQLLHHHHHLVVSTSSTKIAGIQFVYQWSSPYFSVRWRILNSPWRQQSKEKTGPKVAVNNRLRNYLVLFKLWQHWRMHARTCNSCCPRRRRRRRWGWRTRLNRNPNSLLCCRFCWSGLVLSAEVDIMFSWLLLVIPLPNWVVLSCLPWRVVPCRAVPCVARWLVHFFVGRRRRRRRGHSAATATVNTTGCNHVRNRPPIHFLKKGPPFTKEKEIRDFFIYSVTRSLPFWFHSFIRSLDEQSHPHRMDLLLCCVAITRFAWQRQQLHW